MESEAYYKQLKTPTRTCTHETAVIDIPIDELWPIFREFDLARLFPTYITVCKLDPIDVGKVGATTKAYFSDGDWWLYQILEMDDAKHILTYDVIEAGDPITWSTQISTFKLHKITENNTTFVEWDTFYSNDVNVSVINGNVKKKLTHFIDMRKALQKK